MTKYGVFQPMKYAIAKKQEILNDALQSDNYGMELKVDGSSYVWAKDLDGTVHLYGDRISKKTGEVIDKIDNMPHMKEYAEKNFPAGSQIIVEIWSKYNWTAGKWEDHSSSKFVNSIMLCGPDKAAARQKEVGPCGAYVFDVLFWDGEPLCDEDFADRYEFIMGLKDTLPNTEWLTYAELITEHKAEKIAEWLANGFEGGVLKMLHSTDKVSAKHALSAVGSTAKRPMHTTYKIKQVDTVDVVIIGVEMPTKAYTGTDPDNWKYHDEDGVPVNRLWALGYANAFAIGAYDHDGNLYKIGTVASGLNDEVRKQAADNPDDYVGCVIEVDCMSIDKAGQSLRHPRLMKFRPDKSPHHCTMSVIFG